MTRQPALTITLCGLMLIACNETIKDQSTATMQQDETFDEKAEDEYGEKEDEYGEKEDEYDEEKEDEYDEENEDGYDEEEKEDEYDEEKEDEYDGEEKEDTGCSNSGQDGYRALVQGNDTREYILHVPASYSAENPAALIINFHGFGGCAGDFADLVGNYYGLNTLADGENILVAYPQAVVREKGSAYWEPGDSGTEDIVTNDVFFTRQLIADIASDFNIDPASVYATGYSNGGMMAYDLSCSGSDFIAAAGIMSGIMLSNSCDRDEPTSIIHFHGIADSAIPYDGSGDFPAVLDVVDFWLTHNSISPSSLVTTELNNGDVVRDEYTGGSENSAVALYTVFNENNEEGGNVWFSADIDGQSPNQILWSFLSRYRLDD